MTERLHQTLAFRRTEERRRRRLSLRKLAEASGLSRRAGTPATRR